MRIDELKEQPIIVDLTNESVEVQSRVKKALDRLNKLGNRWEKRIELAKIAQAEGWTEEHYDAECAKRNI
ncbi:MAG: hypothetical protein HC836_40665 [Richelia sp. RM2_1_2]|nr:hypothetical protein [Richelia sp. RM2_1_2]